jgi:heme/copper-type cytochrome/quinol oxidase subunit 2
MSFDRLWKLVWRTILTAFISSLVVGFVVLVFVNVTGGTKDFDDDKMDFLTSVALKIGLGIIAPITVLATALFDIKPELQPENPEDPNSPIAPAGPVNVTAVLAAGFIAAGCIYLAWFTII